MDTGSDVILWHNKADKIILSIRGVKKYYPITSGALRKVNGYIKAVDNIDLDIAEGKTLGLVGESGCGKSTLARLILKLIEPDSGKILFNGTEIQSLSEKEMKPIRKKMQIIFQDPFGSLNPKMKIGETIEEGLKVLGLDTHDRKEKVKELLEMVGMPAVSFEMYPHEFSGGQRQRICIARALSVNPLFIVCDEPVSALDVSIQAQIINLLRELQTKFNIAYLFISHNINLVGYMSDIMAVMYLGQIVEIAPSEKIFRKPCHPYTKMLLSAVPEPDPQKKICFISKGEIQNFIDIHYGCKFQQRCDLYTPECSKTNIRLKKIDDAHWVRCICI